MKMYKRMAALMAGAMVMSVSIPVAAKQININNELSKLERVATVSRSYNNTTPSIYDVTIKEDSGKKYLMIDASDNTDYVTVDGSKVYTKDGYKYKYQVTKSGTYAVRAYNNAGYVEKRKEVKLDADPTLDLSKSTSGGNTYLVIKAYDDNKIKKVTVNDETFSFSENGETKKYKVTKSGKYTVVVTDVDGNKTEKSLTIDLDDDAPSVTLDKKYNNGKWYLVMKIKPNDGNKISSVKVNNKSVSCNRNGEDIEYEVSSSNTYKVVVRDNQDLETTKSLYIDVNQNTSKPVVTLSTTNVSGFTFLTINVTVSSKVAKLTVNGKEFAISSSGGSVNYPVTASGNYTVVVRDTNGNETTQTLYAAPTQQTTTQQPTTSNTNNSGTQTVVFKMNTKSWTLNGVSQAMDSAPIGKNGRIYIPIRYVSNAIGISASNITWDSTSKTVIIHDGGNTIKVPLNKKTMTVNGQSISMDAPAIQYGGRVMIPISQIKPAFASRNIQMTWDNASKSVIITRN